MKTNKNLRTKEKALKPEVIKTPVWFLLSIFLTISLLLASKDKKRTQVVTNDLNEVRTVELSFNSSKQLEPIQDIMDENIFSNNK